MLLAGGTCLLSWFAKSSWTWACQEADDWFRWCCQFWGENYWWNHLLVCSYYCHLVNMMFYTTLQIDGDLKTTIKFSDALKIPYIAPSFGGCESIVDQPAIMSYWYSLFSNLMAANQLNFLMSYWKRDPNFLCAKFYCGWGVNITMLKSLHPSLISWVDLWSILPRSLVRWCLELLWQCITN